MHQRFIDAINANPDDRAMQLIYADWLDQQGDPRAEAWRVLIEAGKRPEYIPRTTYALSVGWHWFDMYFQGNTRGSMLDQDVMEADGEVWRASPTFYSAMDAAAVAWVRCHRDPEFLRESTTV